MLHFHIFLIYFQSHHASALDMYKTYKHTEHQLKSSAKTMHEQDNDNDVRDGISGCTSELTGKDYDTGYIKHNKTIRIQRAQTVQFDTVNDEQGQYTTESAASSLIKKHHTS